MLNLSIKSLLLLAITTLSLSFVGCKKEDDDKKPVPTASNTAVSISLEQFLGNEPLSLNTTKTVNGIGTQIKISNMYISNVRLMKADGSELALSNKYHLFTGPKSMSSAGNAIPSGNYTGIKFDVGIRDSSVNHGDPTIHPAGSPLAIQTPSMHWNWRTGYIFVRVDGRVDTTGGNTPNKDIYYHLGTLPMRREITINKPITISGSSQTLTLKADIAKMFKDFDLKKEHGFHSPTGGGAARFANNLPAAFSL